MESYCRFREVVFLLRSLPMLYVCLALPHLTSPYKGEAQDHASFLVPLLCKEGVGEVELCLSGGP